MKTIAKLFKGDKGIWMIFFLLSVISLVAVYSSIGRTAIEAIHTSPTQAFIKHLAIVVATYAAIIFISFFNYRFFGHISGLGYLAAVAMLIIVISTSGKRWIQVPIIGQFQPSEIAKVLLVVHTARLLVVNKNKIETLEVFLRLLIVIGIVVALIVFENFSTAALVFFSCFVMMLVGGVKKRYWFNTFFVAVAIGIAGLLFLSKDSGSVEVGRSVTWGNRVEHWLNPDHEELSQENMGRMAIARGKMFGVGVGNTVHARLMTQADNDFIYAIIIEETGMVGGIVVLMLYCVFFYRCIIISRRCKNRKFGALTVFGLGSMIFLQALVNMSVAVGVLPVTGQTLPFISSGGTAYLFMGCGIGIIQAVAHDNNKQEQKEHLEQETEQTIKI